MNALLFKSTKYRNKNKKKKMHREKYDVLTESPAPGTTLEMVTVEEFKLGFRVIDTPGIPNMSQCTAHIQNFADLRDAMPAKRIQNVALNIRQSQSVWLGALCRLDMLSGSEKYFTFYVPQTVAVHRTTFELADRVYRKQAGNILRPAYNDDPDSIEFTKHSIQLDCTDFELANYDIAIEGLGWFSVQGVGFVDLFLHLPFGIKYHVRDKPMRPFMIKDKGGLDKYSSVKSQFMARNKGKIRSGWAKDIDDGDNHQNL